MVYNFKDSILCQLIYIFAIFFLLQWFLGFRTSKRKRNPYRITTLLINATYCHWALILKLFHELIGLEYAYAYMNFITKRATLVNWFWKFSYRFFFNYLVVKYHMMMIYLSKKNRFYYWSTLPNKFVMTADIIRHRMKNYCFFLRTFDNLDLGIETYRPKIDMNILQLFILEIRHLIIHLKVLCEG